MKLLVIILCLVSERFLTHALAQRRFEWFTSYFNAVTRQLPKKGLLSNSIMVLIAVIVPLCLISFLILLLFNHWIYGIIAFLLNLIIFHYCLGPENAFYPVKQSDDDNKAVKSYLAAVNGQLFAVIFWYLITGPVGVLLYRLISLCKGQKVTSKLAKLLANLLDWAPARMTGLFYLLVGNFQHGFRFFAKNLLSPPAENEHFLSQEGLLSVRSGEKESVSMSEAEELVERTVILCVVLIAFFVMTMVL